MTRITKILNITYFLIVLIFLLDNLTSVDIKSQFIKSSIYYGLLLGTPINLVWNFTTIKTNSKRIIGTIIPTIILILILIIGPTFILFSKGAWITQTILYQNGHSKFNTVEYQMQDIGSLGYNKRTVEVLYITPYFMIISKVPDDIEKRVEWIKVDKDINELNLKFP